MVLRGSRESDTGFDRARRRSPRPARRPTSVLPQASLTAASSLRPWICLRRSTLRDFFSPQACRLALYEVYPAAIWTRLARRLPNKRRRDGREARAALLETLGVLVPETLLSHDKLDACAAALLGAAADGRIRDISVVAVGDSVFWDDVTGCLREGQIVVPNVDSGLRAELQTVVRRWELAANARSSIVAPPRASGTARRLEDGHSVARPVLTVQLRRNVATSCWNYSSPSCWPAAQRSARTNRLSRLFSVTRSTRRGTGRN